MAVQVVLSPRRLIGVVATLGLATALVVTAIGAGAATTQADALGLGTAGSYAVLGGSAVTNTGPSVLAGDLGVSPKAAVSGFPPGLVLGAVHSADAAALQAQADLALAYDDAASRGPATAVAAELGGRTLGPGAYAGATLELTGTLTLDARGDPDAVFVLGSASTLVTAANSQVLLIGDASPCNVFWRVSSSATLGTGTAFAGTTMAMVSITANTGATVSGRLLARTGAVTLDSNVITRPSCADLPAGTTTTTTSTSTTIASTTSTTVPGPISTSTTVAMPTSTSVPAPTGTGVPVGNTSTTALPGPGTPITGGSTTLVALASPGPTPPGPGASTTTGPVPGGGPGGPDASPPGTTTTTLARTGADLGPLTVAASTGLAAGAVLLLLRRRHTVGRRHTA
ncbi:MAG: hypothetical protein JWM47_1124 [Acidimicrobiales bacterium]|nr:hypothetical protein [Acidimicrobiales bacterium]